MTSAPSFAAFSNALAAAARATGLQPGKGSDSRFFTTTKKGELHELKEELNSPKLPVKVSVLLTPRFFLYWYLNTYL
jgi:hypothetical protein